MSNKYFKEVIINSEADLPKEEGMYWATPKDGGFKQSMYFLPDADNKELWLEVIASYLLPV